MGKTIEVYERKDRKNKEKYLLISDMFGGLFLISEEPYCNEGLGAFLMITLAEAWSEKQGYGLVCNGFEFSESWHVDIANKYGANLSRGVYVVYMVRSVTSWMKEIGYDSRTC